MALCGYQTSNGYEHVIFIGANNHVYELVCKNGKWLPYTDLTASANALKPGSAPNAAPGSPVVGYQTSNGYEHVNYIGVDQHVHELIYTGQWKDNDLTGSANALKPGSAPAAGVSLGIAGYQTSNGYEHVNYMDDKYHVYELIYANGHWACNNLTTATGVPNAALIG
jgi:hypothetical protein